MGLTKGYRSLKGRDEGLAAGSALGSPALLVSLQAEPILRRNRQIHACRAQPAALHWRDGCIHPMTSCPWPRRSGIIDRLHDWWTPPMRQNMVTEKRSSSEDNQNEQFLELVRQGGFWLS